MGVVELTRIKRIKRILGAFKGVHLSQVHPLEGTHRIRLIRFLYFSNRNPINPFNPLLFLFQQRIRLIRFLYLSNRIRLIRCYFYFSKDADINPLFRLIRSKKSEQKKLETVSL